MSADGLTIAVPRGTLFAETLDRLDRAGLDTSEVRANDRRLLFADAGIVTVRPSDVPTYVEAGAADLGITGKDVLMEQAEREVYELLDLGYGECRMVLATVAGPDPAEEALRRPRGRGVGAEDPPVAPPPLPRTPPPPARTPDRPVLTPLPYARRRTRRRWDGNRGPPGRARDAC